MVLRLAPDEKTWVQSLLLPQGEDMPEPVTEQDLLPEMDAVRTGHDLGVTVSVQTIQIRLEEILKKQTDELRRTQPSPFGKTPAVY